MVHITEEEHMLEAGRLCIVKIVEVYNRCAVKNMLPRRLGGANWGSVG
jgi:hypothetical protein